MADETLTREGLIWKITSLLDLRTFGGKADRPQLLDLVAEVTAIVDGKRVVRRPISPEPDVTVATRRAKRVRAMSV